MGRSKFFGGLTFWGLGIRDWGLPIRNFFHLGKLMDLGSVKQGEFSKRAIINGKTNLVKAEAINDLINSQTEEQRAIALKQFNSGLSGKLQQWRKQLIKCMATVEAVIDFSDEEDAPSNIDIKKDVLCEKRIMERERYDEILQTR